jgi:hypothetical protein
MSDPCQYVISTLEDHNSRLDKEAIVLAQAEAGNKEFFEGCRLALDSMITFGLKQIPEKTDEDGPGYLGIVLLSLLLALYSQCHR